MFDVVVVGQTPKQLVRSMRMLAAAGYQPVRMELGRLTYRLMDEKDLQQFRWVERNVPGHVVLMVDGELL